MLTERTVAFQVNHDLVLARNQTQTLQLTVEFLDPADLERSPLTVVGPASDPKTWLDGRAD